MASLERWLYSCQLLKAYNPDKEGLERTNDPDEAVLYSSEVKSESTGVDWLDNEHMPTLDIDAIPCRLVESSTPGNYHLFIDKPMSWNNYKTLLEVLAKVGIIEDSFYKMALKRKATFLRVRDKKYDPNPGGKLVEVGSGKQLADNPLKSFVIEGDEPWWPWP